MPVLTRPTTTGPSAGPSWRRRGIVALTLAVGLALAPLITAGSAQAEGVHHRAAHHPHHHHRHPPHHVHHRMVHHAPAAHPHG